MGLIWEFPIILTIQLMQQLSLLHYSTESFVTIRVAAKLGPSTPRLGDQTGDVIGLKVLLIFLFRSATCLLEESLLSP